MSGFTLHTPENGVDRQAEAASPKPYDGSVLGQYSDEMREEILAMLHRDLGWDGEDARMDAEASAQ